MKEKLLSYGANFVIIWSAIVLYHSIPYYSSFLSQNAKAVLVFGAILYSLSVPLYILRKSAAPSKGLVILKALKRYLNEWRTYTGELRKGHEGTKPRLLKEEKIAVLFLLVKLYFLPIMVNFAVGNFSDLQHIFATLNWSRLLEPQIFISVTYPFLLSLIFFIDTFYFTFGYMFESKHLDNVVRSVEPTVAGWVVALLCYPPFNNSLTEKIFPWYGSDYVRFSTPDITIIAYVCIVILFTIYLWATLSLGTKSSNLTNRGIVDRGPYAFVRHPHYASKNLAWWITLLPILTLPAIVSMAGWTFIYYLRAITEERHLMQDPDYQAYAKKVKYRFIPYVF